MDNWKASIKAYHVDIRGLKLFSRKSLWMNVIILFINVFFSDTLIMKKLFLKQAKWTEAMENLRKI